MEVKSAVAEYYGKTVQKTEDLAYDACCTTDYDPELTGNLTEEVLQRRYGCGSPIPPLLEGATVVDLGSGAGADCFIASQLAGPNGRVIGVDMTPEQLEVARRNVAPHMERFGFAEANVEFLEGYIEDVPVDDESADIVISNCVINLSDQKQKVFDEIWRVLRPSGEFYISDIVADRRIPAELQKDETLWGECLSGAAYVEDLRRMMGAAGFRDVRVVSSRRLADEVRGIGFSSRVLRGFKLDLEDRCEDYGQVAVYQGTIEGQKSVFELDATHRFPAGEAIRVCKNTADILIRSRYGAHFDVSPPLGHLGLFEGAESTSFSDEVEASDETDVPESVSCC